MPQTPALLARGVYRVHPDGPNGEVILIVVDSSGARIRTTDEIDAGAAAAMADELYVWLELRDPLGVGVTPSRLPPRAVPPSMRALQNRQMLRAI